MSLTGKKHTVAHQGNQNIAKASSTLKSNCKEDMKSLTVGILSVVLNKPTHITSYKVKTVCLSCSIATNSEQNHLERTWTTKSPPQLQVPCLFSLACTSWKILLFHASHCCRNTFPASGNI